MHPPTACGRATVAESLSRSPSRRPQRPCVTRNGSGRPRRAPVRRPAGPQAAAHRSGIALFNSGGRTPAAAETIAAAAV